jgi:hypothetical protein
MGELREVKVRSLRAIARNDWRDHQITVTKRATDECQARTEAHSAFRQQQARQSACSNHVTCKVVRVPTRSHIEVHLHPCLLDSLQLYFSFFEGLLDGVRRHQSALKKVSRVRFVCPDWRPEEEAVRFDG